VWPKRQLDDLSSLSVLLRMSFTFSDVFEEFLCLLLFFVYDLGFLPVI